ncbi:hypothetical protein HZA26_03430 [Candidatus Nomurabacteria bacterium]|nr:hypothetical protein [Candidatus Nomurabacteria bacterium]
MLLRSRRKQKKFLVEPDEIFLDSKNIQNFDVQQFEGRIEKTISKKTILVIGLFFIFSALIMSVRLGYLQIKRGEELLKRSENNTLQKVILFAERGIIYDRNKKELAWNEKKVENDDFSTRKYLDEGFSHILGYISYPAKDKSGFYWQSEFTAKDGLEKKYDEIISGQNGSKVIEVDVHRNVQSENVVNVAKHGEDLITTIDSRVQKELFTLIKNLSENNSFNGGAGIIMDVRNGEIIASTSFPEYDGEILSEGKEAETIKNYFRDKRKVFLDRVISGIYTPGSIVKPFFALGALTENVIDPNKKILSTGSISIPNPYFPDKETVFKDWKAHGWVDMEQAIAVSSDVYFYEIGGGFEGQKGLGILNLEKYIKLFGVGEKTNVDLPDEISGIIPNPEWKKKNFDGDIWRVGDTYNTSIGQYGFQVTPIEMVRAIGAVANFGTLQIPHFILGDKTKEEQAVVLTELKKENYDIVHSGMRQAVTYGTAVALNVPYVEVAAKTGTAQLGVLKNRVNSWVVGFFPYENPKYAFTIMMESGPSTGTINAASIMRGLLDWMSINTPEYFQ